MGNATQIKVKFGSIDGYRFFVKIVSAAGVAAPEKKPLISIGISEHLEETKKLLSEMKGLKEKRGRSITNPISYDNIVGLYYRP
ncbi:hypothetical protein [Bartonella phoceensis]|uniref:hypothetical protein n=1 Tax=Bartonella phoceensis TaxID=270249 RepID=UPI001ABB9D6A|nr:hypothetical protein [Bartonella phoceensis]